MPKVKTAKIVHISVARKEAADYIKSGKIPTIRELSQRWGCSPFRVSYVLRQVREQLGAPKGKRGRPAKAAAAPVVAKRRGRPAKVEAVPVVAKRRGRPAKVEAVPVVVKRRGRPAKVTAAPVVVEVAKRRGRPPGSKNVQTVTKRRGRPPVKAVTAGIGSGGSYPVLSRINAAVSRVQNRLTEITRSLSSIEGIAPADIKPIIGKAQAKLWIEFQDTIAKEMASVGALAKGKRRRRGARRGRPPGSAKKA